MSDNYKILQICVPAQPTFCRRREMGEDGKIDWKATPITDPDPIDLWALIEEDGDRRIVGIEMADMEYLVDTEEDFASYTTTPPREKA